MDDYIRKTLERFEDHLSPEWLDGLIKRTILDMPPQPDALPTMDHETPLFV